MDRDARDRLVAEDHQRRMGLFGLGQLLFECAVGFVTLPPLGILRMEPDAPAPTE